MMPIAEQSRTLLLKISALVLLCGIAGMLPAAARAQRYLDFTVPRPLPPNSYLIIGFMGSLERWNSDVRPVRKLALDLRAKGLPNVYVETVENRHIGLAVHLVREALDSNRNGKLDPKERAAAHIILYGHSLGGAAVVTFARALKSLGVPVALTVQVDSVGFTDRTIPENVARAANFYQHTSPLVRGRARIRAENPQKTSVIGNFRYDYSHKRVDLSEISFFERTLGGAHTRMEFDPDVWAAVEHLILEEID